MRPKPDIIARHRQHVEAMANAEKWATKGLELVSAGKIKQAQDAERKAIYWLEKAKRLEP